MQDKEDSNKYELSHSFARLVAAGDKDPRFVDGWKGVIGGGKGRRQMGNRVVACGAEGVAEGYHSCHPSSRSYITPMMRGWGQPSRREARAGYLMAASACSGAGRGVQRPMVGQDAA
jgi:hypothetical protein